MTLNDIWFVVYVIVVAGYLILEASIWASAFSTYSSPGMLRSAASRLTASAPNTLTAMLIIALSGMPTVLLYTSGVYYFFRGTTQLDTHSRA